MKWDETISHLHTKIQTLASSTIFSLKPSCSCSSAVAAVVAAAADWFQDLGSVPSSQT